LVVSGCLSHLAIMLSPIGFWLRVRPSRIAAAYNARALAFGADLSANAAMAFVEDERHPSATLTPLTARHQLIPAMKNAKINIVSPHAATIKAANIP